MQCVVACCRAENDGGALYISGNAAVGVTLSNITQCMFLNNTAYTGNGGALYMDGGVTSLSSTGLYGNAADGYGGGVYYSHSCFNLSTVIGKANCDAHTLSYRYGQSRHPYPHG